MLGNVSFFIFEKKRKISHFFTRNRVTEYLPLLCDSSRRTSDIGHRFRVTSDFRSLWSNFLMPDVVSGVQCPVSNAQCPMPSVQCPVSIIGDSVTFLPDTGHRTIPSNLALWQGGGGVLCNPDQKLAFKHLFCGNFFSFFLWPHFNIL